MTVGGDARERFDRDTADVMPTLFRFAVTLSSLDDADDLVQDALARAWHRRADFDPARGTWRAWLLAIVADQARARWRRRRVDVLVDPELVGAGPEVAGPDATTPTSLDVAAAVNALPHRQRTALVLQAFVDLPLTDIAEVMRCSVGTVKATVHAARANLATTLGDSYARD